MSANLLDSLVLQELPTVERGSGLRKTNPLNTAKTAAGMRSIYVNPQMSMGKAEPEFGTRLQKSLLNALDDPEATIERLAFEQDPQRCSTYASIYVPKLQGIPDSLLKRIVIQDDLVAAIVHARCNHVSAFGRKQADRHATGFKFVPEERVIEKLDEEGQKRLQERISRAEKLLVTCGNINGWNEQDKCSFSEFLYMQTRNTLVMGRMATEVIWTPDPDAPADGSRRRFHSFRPTDAGTIYYAAHYHEVNQQVREMALRLMENLKNEKLKKEKFENEEYAWVQVFEGRPMQAFGPQEMLVHSPYMVTDIEQMGYPVTPIDTVLSAVTTHINITNHNRLYFQSGRSAKGMLIIKSADIDPEIVNGVRQQFNASINSVQNCLAGDTQIITDKGAVTLEGFLNGAETRMTRLWTGTSWQPAMVYRVAEKKELCSVETANGLKLECSPNHRFWVIGEDGEPSWKMQKDIKNGDYIAVNKNDSSNTDMAVEFMGKPMTTEMMEILGWMTGDGTLSNRGVRLFYHHSKERDIWERHGEILRSWGLPAVNRSRNIPESEKQALMERHGFKSIADERIWIELSSAEVARELQRIGFTLSKRGTGESGKSIPSFVYAAPSSLKCAFLRGFFSADGNNADGISPTITICNHRLRKQTRELLASMGIRCTFSEGKTRNQFIPGGHVKERGASYLKIKDRKEFFQKIGFIQAHKQPRESKGTNKDWGTSNGIACQTVMKYLRIVKDKTKLPRGGNDHNVGLTSVFTRRQHMDIDEILRGERGCSLSRLLNYMSIAEVEIPSWMSDFNYEPVVKVTASDVKVQMFDTTVYNPSHVCLGPDCQSDEHSLMTGSIYTHQSWRMPVFGLGPEDELTWAPIDSGGGRDMEFQYLSDANCRTILAAFQMSPEELPGYSHLCLHPDTRVWTRSGSRSLREILGSSGEVSGFEVWTGTSWCSARAFVTGERAVKKTVLDNGVELLTSPEHRFRIIDEFGNLAWREQADLRVGDHVLVERNSVEGSEQCIPSYHGRRLSPEMLEVLGWLTGDGTLAVRKRGLRKHSKELSFYYHHDKEIEIRERHLRFMEAFGLSPKRVDKVRSETAVKRMVERGNFGSVSAIRRSIELYNTEFAEWLLSIGFNASSGRKNIPAFIYGMPEEYRASFLRGFFSADGSKDSLDTPHISICNSELRKETRELLLTLGIRTRLCEGTHRTDRVRGQDGSWHSVIVKKPSRLTIKDKVRFFDLVGFLQPHKQPSPMLRSRPERWDKVSRNFAVSVADRILSIEGLSGSERDSVRHKLKDPKHNCQTREKVLSLADFYGVEIPAWVDDYYQEEVVYLSGGEERVVMMDVEVFDIHHAFMAEGITVHNSRGTNSQALSESSNEYVLTAARDVGIRPLLASFEDFLNSSILPLIDEELAKVVRLKLIGLDVETEEKESVRIQQDMGVHMTFNDVLKKLEKKTLPKFTGADIPLNPTFAQYMSSYMTFGEILEHFCGKQGASQDPNLAFYQNPFWQNNQQMVMQQQQMAQQQQQMAQQPPGGAPPEGGGQPPSGGGSPSQSEEETELADQQRQGLQKQNQPDMSNALDQLSSVIQKSEGGEGLVSKAKKLRARNVAANRAIMNSFLKDIEHKVKSIADIASEAVPSNKV